MIVLGTLSLALGVCQEVLLQIDELRIRLVAHGTSVRLDAVVDHFVLFQVGALHKCLITTCALVRLYSTVQQLMLQHVGVL